MNAYETLMKFKKTLGGAGTVFGLFAKTCDPAFVECAGHGGFDFVILDMEHGPVSFEKLGDLVRAATVAGIVPIVRTADDHDSTISKALDLGAAGVQIPQVAKADQARRIVRSAKFAPIGSRGLCRFVRAADYSSLPRENFLSRANEGLLIVHLEGRDAMAELDEILKVREIDVLFIGPYDLSQSLGVPGQVEHPDVMAMMKEIVTRAHAAEMVVGTFADTPKMAGLWAEAGVQYLAYSVDVGIFTDACRRITDRLAKD